MYDMSGFNYDITDVVHLLQLRVRHKNSSSMDVNCPFCGETKGKMNVNLQKNVFRCNRCDASGGMLELYGRLHGVSSAEANRQIREALGKGEYRTNYQVAPKKEPVVIFNAELADADVIDRTYQEMLSLLTLNDKHQEDLKKRGLTEEQIEIQRYRSVPLFGIKNMVQKLLESGQTVKGVPGFYEDQDGKWTINFSSKNSGILIPIQSPEGKIQGFQIRLDQVMEGRKYIWLSSVKFKNGVSSGSPVHVMCQCMEQNQVRMGNILFDEPQKILQELENLLEKDEIKKLFCAEYKEICKECDYRYICGGRCMASEEPYDYRCIFLKAVLNYVLFYYQPKENRKKNLEIYMEYMEAVKRKWEKEANEEEKSAI